MSLIQIVFLALVQGVTEFLPISSSGHLIITSQILGWPDQGLAFDVAVHFGTLFAVLLYFRRDLLPLIQGLFKHNDHSRLAWGIVIATIPCALVGLLANHFIATHLRTPHVIIATTLLFGILLGMADAYSRREKDKQALTLPRMLIIGLSQILALMPGTSRSGITMTSGLFCGLSRQQASRFSFLLAIPIILLASGYEGMKLAMQPVAVHWPAIMIAVIIAMLSAYTCIALFLKLIERIGFWPFVLYRIFLALALTLWLSL